MTRRTAQQIHQALERRSPPLDRASCRESLLGSNRVIHAAAFGFLVATTSASAARAADSPPDVVPAAREARPWNLGLFTGLGYLGSPGADGGAFLGGLRLGLGRHFAASVDLGYGLESAPSTMQDRWWVIPAASLVIPAGSVRIDLGAGAGVGTSSGYVSWSDYAARPFTPIWHYTVPAVRAHLGAAMSLSPGLDVFARADVASLLAVGSQAGAMDTTWFALWVGVQPRLL
jgi:hypothetical protein